MASNDEAFSRQQRADEWSQQSSMINERHPPTQLNQNARIKNTSGPMSGSNIVKNNDGTTIISLSDLKGKNNGKFTTQQPGTLTD